MHVVPSSKMRLRSSKLRFWFKCSPLQCLWLIFSMLPLHQIKIFRNGTFQYSWLYGPRTGAKEQAGWISKGVTIRSFQMLSKEDLTGMGFPHPAITEIKDLIKQVGDTLRTPGVNAETPSPLHVETPSTASNENCVLSMLTASELKRLTETLDLKSAAGLREFNRMLVAEMVKLAVVLFFFIDILNLKVLTWIEKKT